MHSTQYILLLAFSKKKEFILKMDIMLAYKKGMFSKVKELLKGVK